MPLFGSDPIKIRFWVISSLKNQLVLALCGDGGLKVNIFFKMMYIMNISYWATNDMNLDANSDTANHSWPTGVCFTITKAPCWKWCWVTNKCTEPNRTHMDCIISFLSTLQWLKKDIYLNFKCLVHLLFSNNTVAIVVQSQSVMLHC